MNQFQLSLILSYVYLFLVQVKGDSIDENVVQINSFKSYVDNPNHSVQVVSYTVSELLKFDMRELNDGANETSSNRGTATPSSEKEKNTGHSSFFSVVFLLILVVLGYLIRRRLDDKSLNSGRWINGAIPLPTDDFDEDEMINYRKQEMVVMTSGHDDWEWDDDTRLDLEQGLSPRTDGKSVQQNKSRSENEVPPSYSHSSSFKSRHMSSSSAEKTDLSGVSSISTSSIPRSNTTTSKIFHHVQANVINDDSNNWDDEDDWDDNPISSSTNRSTVALSTSSTGPVNANKDSAVLISKNIQTTMTSGPHTVPSIEELLKEQELTGKIPVISSLGKRTVESRPNNPSAKKKEEVHEEDDIFASMGLSAIPKTNTSTKKEVNSASLPTHNLKLSPKSSSTPSASSFGSVTAKKYIEPDDVESNWGDDSDLNDLLED